MRIGSSLPIVLSTVSSCDLLWWFPFALKRGFLSEGWKLHFSVSIRTRQSAVRNSAGLTKRQTKILC